MGSSLRIVASSNEVKPSLEQQLRDHQAIVDAYLDTHLTRNHAEGTRRQEESFLKRWFAQQGDGLPLLLWKAMEPVRGRERIVAYAKQLLQEKRLAGSTVGARLGMLRRLFDYVLAWPYIPGTTVSIQARYAPIEQPVLPYDYPAHVWGGRREDAPLTRPELRGFYSFGLKRVRGARKAAIAARDYTMLVLCAESGLRVKELCSLEIHRDLLFDQGRLQTRFGKGTRGSGPRVRQTLFTPFAQATARHFIQHARSRFHAWSHRPTLFLSERGRPMTEPIAQQAMRVVARDARKAGLRIPPRFGWHSLRRSFATIYSEEHPGSDHTLMEMLGHVNPSTLHRYIHHSRAYHEGVMDEVLASLLSDR